MIHDDVDPAGRQHVSGTITRDIATADGFSGRFTLTFGQNVSGPVIVGEFRGFPISPTRSSPNLAMLDDLSTSAA